MLQTVVWVAIGVLAGCGDGTHDDVAPAGDASTASGGAPVLTVLPPDKLGVLAGSFYVPAPEQSAIGFYGTDLGVSVQHGDELRVLFGDTWADPSGMLIDPERDDVQGVISTLPAPGGFPDGDAVDAFAAAQDLAADAPWWKRAAPALTFHTENAKVAPFELYRGGNRGQPALDMGVGKAVVAAFSNARDGVFAIFRRDVAVPCSGGDDPRCDDGFECDRELGICSNAAGEYAAPCVLGSDRCGQGAQCVAALGGGYCQDRTSSMYLAGDGDGRLDAVVIQHELGNADPELPARYYTRPWLTNKFTNPLAKTVADFDPERANPSENDYRPADGSQPEREKVLIWGRPHTVGTAAVGRDARLYFAYVEMPEYSARADFAWSPHYFAGLEGGRPRYSPLQSEAVALDLDGEPSAEAERFDVVDKMAIAYLAPLHVWVMLYGGDFAPPILNLFVGPNFGRVARDPEGAIHARFAEHPWGPWSAPVPALAAGDSSLSTPEPGSEYAPSGLLYHSGCIGPSCIPGELAISHLLTPYGFLYAPNLFDPWTETRESGRAVDVYWNVSTWNPYQTVLLRTRIRR